MGMLPRSFADIKFSDVIVEDISSNQENILFSESNLDEIKGQINNPVVQNDKRHTRNFHTE